MRLILTAVTRGVAVVGTLLLAAVLYTDRYWLSHAPIVAAVVVGVMLIRATQIPVTKYGAVSLLTLAAGACGLLVEVHPDPDGAMSDGISEFSMWPISLFTGGWDFLWEAANWSTGVWIGVAYLAFANTALSQLLFLLALVALAGGDGRPPLPGRTSKHGAQGRWTCN